MPPKRSRNPVVDFDLRVGGPPTPSGESEDDQPSRPLPLHERPPHPTINLLPGHPPGYCIQANQYFVSETWEAVLRPDVEALLAGFVSAYEAPEVSEENEASTSEVPMGRSAVEVFQRVWRELGWERVHTLGVMEGRLRLPWAESVVRSFLEHLTPSTAPTRQLGALLAISTFYHIQARLMEKVHLAVDPPTFLYILSLPPLFPTPPQHLEILETLSSLLSSSAFFLIPTPTFSHPPIPSVYIRDAHARAHAETAKAVLGAEEEVLELRKGKFPIRLPEDLEEEEASVSGGLGEGGRGWDEKKGWRASLKEREEEYLRIKETGFSSRKKVKFMHDCLSAAEEMTLRALREAGSAAEGVVPRISTGQAKNLDLFGLVGEAGSEKGLRAFERCLEEGEREGGGRNGDD